MVRTRDFLVILPLFIAAGVMLVVLARVVLPRWWERARWRLPLLAAPALDVLLPSLWFALHRVGQADAADGLVTAQLLLMAAQLAAAGLLVMVAGWRSWRRSQRPSRHRQGRRRFLVQGAALAVPAVAVAAGAGGVVEAAGPVRLRRRVLRSPGLPPALHGLRILHLSDIHLWHLVTVDDLERALAAAPRGGYDLVCVTGDLADDMSQLPRGLELIHALDAPLGVFACLGNHEHSRDLPGALAAYADSPVQLLRGAGRLLWWRGAPVAVAGIDDLRSQPRARQSEFYPDQLRRALGPLAPETFTVLLSHRPSVLPHAAAAGVDVVLAGHTHGGQAAIAGRSILEIQGSAPWAWGVYRHQGCVMHVTSGLGQWFPLRLGCPPEMVLLELQAADSPSS
jgi:predicted MPP superfamily phosphohydrolase